jgi:hypothetical protein
MSSGFGSCPLQGCLLSTSADPIRTIVKRAQTEPETIAKSLSEISGLCYVRMSAMSFPPMSPSSGKRTLEQSPQEQKRHDREHTEAEAVNGETLGRCEAVQHCRVPSTSWMEAFRADVCNGWKADTRLRLGSWLRWITGFSCSAAPTTDV